MSNTTNSQFSIFLSNLILSNGRGYAPKSIAAYDGVITKFKKFSLIHQNDASNAISSIQSLLNNVVATKGSQNYHSNNKQALDLYIDFLKSIQPQQSQQLHQSPNQLDLPNQLDHYLDTLQKSNPNLITALPNTPTLPIPINILKKKYVSTRNLENFLCFFLNKRYESRINWAQTYVQQVDQIRIDINDLFAPEISRSSTYFQDICNLRNIVSTYTGSIRNETFYGGPNYEVPIVNISNSDANDIILMLEYFRDLVKYNIQNYPNQKYPNIPTILLSYKSNHSNPITSNSDPFNVTGKSTKQNKILKIMNNLENIAQHFKVTLGINDEWINNGLIRVNDFIVDPFGIYYYQDFYSPAKLPLIELFGSKIALFALAHNMSVEKAYRKVLIHELAHAVQHRGGNHIDPKWSQGNSIMSQVSDILIEGSAQLYTKMLSRTYGYELEYYNILDHSPLEYQIQEIWYFIHKNISVSIINYIFDQIQSNASITSLFNKSSKIYDLMLMAPNFKFSNSSYNFKFSNSSYNKIWFGAPGTGKSYQINQIIKKHTDQVSRVVFYPNYSNAQFVGSYKPTMMSGQIQYKFVSGPFLKILVKAIINPSMTYYMIIEDINRADALAVFGNMFQLLERDSQGESEYKINISADILDYLQEENKIYESPFLNNVITNQKLFIPKNLYIWATMNPADQGVFPLDTAFKRRWDFEYVSINPN